MPINLAKLSPNELIEGDRSVHLERISIEEAKTSPNQYLMLTFSLVGAPERKFFERLHFTTPGALGRTADVLLKLLGTDEIPLTVHESELTGGIRLTKDNEDALFAMVEMFRNRANQKGPLRAEFGIEEYENRQTSQITGYMPYTWQSDAEAPEETQDSDDA